MVFYSEGSQRNSSWKEERDRRDTVLKIWEDRSSSSFQSNLILFSFPHFFFFFFSFFLFSLMFGQQTAAGHFEKKNIHKSCFNYSLTHFHTIHPPSCLLKSSTNLLSFDCQKTFFFFPFSWLILRYTNKQMRRRSGMLFNTPTTTRCVNKRREREIALQSLLPCECLRD